MEVASLQSKDKAVYKNDPCLKIAGMELCYHIMVHNQQACDCIIFTIGWLAKSSLFKWCVSFNAVDRHQLKTFHLKIHIHIYANYKGIKTSKYYKSLEFGNEL